MVNGTCIVMSPELKDLHNKDFSRLNEKIFKDFVSRWREEYNKPEGIPTKDDLIGIIVKLVPNWSDFLDFKDIHPVNIYASTNENAILSNFAKRPFTYEDGVYDSVEQAFQIHKMLMVDPSDLDRFNSAQSIISRMQTTTNGSTLKNLGNTRILTIEELKAWDSVKFDIMKNLIRASLQQNPRVLKALMNTGSNPITHIQASGEWRVKFPIILEELRGELKDYPIGNLISVEIYSGYWTRDEVSKQTDKVFLFGDNTDDRLNTNYIPKSTQAVIRGLPNAIGIDTKKDRRTSNNSYFTDTDFDSFKIQVDNAIQKAIDSGRTIVIPADGIGTGKAQLKERAPKLFAYLQEELNRLQEMSTMPIDYGIHTSEHTQFVDVTNWHRIDGEFSSIRKRQRINLINKLFTREINRIQEEETSRLNNELELADTNTKKLALAKAIRNIRPYTIIKTYGPYELYSRVKSIFEQYIDSYESNKEALLNKELENLKLDSNNAGLPDVMLKSIAESNVEYAVKAYRQLVDNFNEFAVEAANSYSYNHNVIMSAESNTISEGTEVESTNAEGHNHIQEIADSKEESSYKEGWQVNVRELSAYESMSNKVRDAIDSIERRGLDGSVMIDDLGYPQTLESSYVFAELISALKSMTSADEMMSLLENLAKRKPWASQVVDAVRNDDQLFTAFYTVFRKDYLNMWVHRGKARPDGSLGFKTSLINRPSGTAHYFDSWRDNYEYGIVLDKDSIYDKNGDINVSNTSIGLDIVNRIEDLFRGKSKAERQDIILNNSNSIHKALSMLGVSITPDVLDEVLKYNYNPDNKADLIGEVVLYNLRIIYKGIPDNPDIKDGMPADLINHYGSAFNNIAIALNYIEEDEVESNVRQRNKSLYAHTRPSYMTTLVKKLKGPNYEEFINSEYKDVDFLFDKNYNRWKNSWIDNLLNDKESRDKLDHAVVIEYEGKEYNEWTPLETFLVLYNQYNAEPVRGAEGYAWYQSPLLSDATSAEFLKGKRYKKNYQNILSDKFYDLVMQEYNRIILVKNRSNNPDIEKIASFDITDKSEGGAKFHFLPELNSTDYNLIDIIGSSDLEDGTYFVGDLTEDQLKLGTNQRNFVEAISDTKEDIDVLKSLVKGAVARIMDSRFNDAVVNWKAIGLFDKVNEDNPSSSYLYFNSKSENALIDNLREYYWNTTYAQSQIIQILTTDLAYYKDYTDFTKRALEFHSPTDKLNPFAKWDGKYVAATQNSDGLVIPRKRRVIYLKDEVKPSASINDVKEALDSNTELTDYDKSVIISLWNRVNVTDAQALTTLKSYRQTQIMADLWSDESERAYTNIRNNKWDMKDFMVLWNTRKPYMYTQTNQSDGLGGTLRVPTQHKNSEMIMLTSAIFGSILSHSRKLSALSEFMEQNDIDVAQFTTAVKVGGKGVIDLNGDLSKDEVTAILNSKLYINGKDVSNGLNMDRVHEFNFDDYGIQVATPDHGVDSDSLVGTQIRRLIAADQSDTAEFIIGDKKLTKEQWHSYFNAVNTANIREAFDALNDIFNNPKKVEEILLSEIRSSSRYSNDLIEAVSLNDNGEFNIPLYDFTTSQKLQELLNSIIKSRIVKQKINGGSLIMASPWVLNEEDKPRIVWEGTGSNKRIKYIEAYIPCPDSKLYELLIDENGGININKKDAFGNYIVPEEYRKAIGYRIPTEDKYSMLPIRVKGFLPRQTGSVIILPEEVTTTMGADYDVDKIYMMYKSLKIDTKYDIKRAWDDFYISHPEVVAEIDRVKSQTFVNALRAISEVDPELVLDIESIEDIEEYRNLKQYEWVDYVRPMFSEWFNIEKSKYLERKSVRVDEYKHSDINSLSGDDLKKSVYYQAKKNSKSQRDNLMIDLMFSVLTNPDTVIKQITPGGFEEQKRNARIVNLLNSLTLDEVEALGGVDRILSLSTKDAEKLLEKYGKSSNPLVPDTWIDYQQRNMSGAGLIPMAATQNASHAITQLIDGFKLKNDRSFIFNGDRLSSLSSVKNRKGEFISRNICSYLAAFVDNAKDPVAGDLNINEVTANLAFTLLRIGNSPMTVSLILRQPAMMDIMKLMNTGKYTVEQAIEELIDKYKKLQGNQRFGKKTYDFNFTDTWLAENICAANNVEFNSKHIAEHDFANRQLRVLVMLNSMFESAEAVGDVVRALRSDTQSGAVGGNIAAGNEKIIRVKNLLDANITNPKHPLEGVKFINAMDNANSEDDIITSPTPIQTAMYQYGLVSARKWLAKYFPQASENFMDMVEEAKALTTYGRLDEGTINRMYNQYIVYLMTEISNDFNGSKENRNKYINEFPIEFGHFKKDNPYLVESLPILRRLKSVFSNKYNSSSLIKFHNVGTVTEIQSDNYRSDFRNLSMHDNTREYAKQLMVYHFYRGMGFSPSGFATLFPSSFKTDNITDYVSSLRRISGMQTSDYGNFLVQYIRNNMDDRRFVPDVTSTGLFSDTPPDNFSITVDKNSALEFKRFIYPDTKNGIRYRKFVVYYYNNKPYYYIYDSEYSKYVRVETLGNKNYQEYDALDNGVLMESVIKDSHMKEFNMDDSLPVESVSENALKDLDEKLKYFNELPPITPDDLMGSREDKYKAQFEQMDKYIESEPSMTSQQFDALEAMYAQIQALEASDVDMEGNNRCK